MTRDAAAPAGSVLVADSAVCRTPITGGVLDSATAQRLAGVLRALGEPTRLRLVSMIAAQPGGQACVCELTDPVGLSQPTVSHHLKVLVEAGLLEREQRGKWAYYRVVPGVLDALADVLAGERLRPRAVGLPQPMLASTAPAGSADCSSAL
jgi:ArsR family transcriptional regulator